MKKTALTLTTLIVLVGLFVNKVSAQEVLPLTVVPPKQEVLINPGENFSTSVKFLNQGSTPVSGTLSVVDFVVVDDKGTPLFLDNPQVVGTTVIPAKYSAAKWISIPNDSMTIPAKGNASVSMTVKVPKTAAPGGRYAAVIFQPGGNLSLGKPADGQENAIAIRLASLIYIRVAGPITEGATVTKFDAPSFLEYGPIPVTTDITNQGDYHIAPKGTVTVTDMFGRVVGTSTLESLNIFPGTSRTYVNQLGEKVMFGKFTLNLLANYGESNKAISSTLTMWVFPWRVTVAIVLAIIIIVLLINLWYKKFVKKEAKLEEELKEEKTELEALKEELKDKGVTDVKVEVTKKPEDSSDSSKTS